METGLGNIKKFEEGERKKWDWKKEIETNEYMSPIHKRIIERLHDPNFKPFKLDPSFVGKYAKKKPAFGFNGLGEITYLRTYSRLKHDGNRERWHDTVERVVNGTFNLQKRYAKDHGLRWDDYQAKEHAEEMFDRIFNFKFLPPGRGLWAMGTEITEERGLYAALNNCAFVSTEKIDDLEFGYSKPFKFLMDMSMLGVGVGFDTNGAGKVIVRGPDKRRGIEEFVIPDTREGWVESVGRQIDSYFFGTAPIKFNYTKIRPRGEYINGFGGKSSGPEPLQDLHQGLESLLNNRLGWPLTSGDIVDTQNLIGKGVVAGNVRRTAEIAFGKPGDEEFLDLKNPDLYPNELKSHRWASNNSILAEIGMDYKEIAERIMKNGEPGLIWLENVRHYGRMIDPKGDWDIKAEGANPCVEQSLESYEICNLVETFPANHDSLDDFKRTLKFAYLYAKTVSLGESHWEETNRVLQRNRRIGTSMTGIQQLIAKIGMNEAIRWWDEGFKTIFYYDNKYSDEWFAVRRSIKKTSVKPSGTVSLLPGATPGMHWVPGGEYVKRRILFSKDDPLVEMLKEKGYHVEDSVYDKYSSVVIFPVHVPGIKVEEKVSMWEQLEMAAMLQYYWADNQVSCTIKFDKEREGDQIADALSYFQYRLKGISFLPHSHGYEQAPYEAITREEYFEMVKNIKPLDESIYALAKGDAIGEKFCNNDSCEIAFPVK
ncbi:MAG: fused protease/ribonucleoside-triphosphate reductase [Candidatus Pacearchaeota archaeon]